MTSHNPFKARFTDLFIQRPVLAIVLNLVILMLGVISIMHLPVRQFPKIETSVISVTTSYPGANAKLIEGFVTSPLENALSGIDGVDYLKSTSRPGTSDITLHLQLGYDINKALISASNQITAVKGTLPDAVKGPWITKQDPNANPTLYLKFDSPNLTKEALTDYLDRNVKPQLATISGIGKVEIFGGSTYAMRIWLDPEKMAAHNVTANDVQHALQNNNVQSAAGKIDTNWEQFTVNAATNLTTAQQFNNMVIAAENGHFVRLKDVGYANLGSVTSEVTVTINDKPTVVLAIIPKSTANPLDLANKINTLFTRLKPQFPEGMHAVVAWDTSKFIRQSLTEVQHTIVEAILFVILVILLFLGSLRTVFIPVVTIPLALIGACFMMFTLGYSLNTLTFLAWVLAIGLVVDDAIVVVENIHRHIEAGLPAMEAALKGAREISFAVVAMTLTLAAVYAPIGFMEGLTGALFREFAFTLAGAVIVSGFIALTLTPMLCSRLIKPHSGNTISDMIDSVFNAVASTYQQALRFLLHKKWYVVVVALAIYASCYFLYVHTPAQLAPKEDQSVVLTMLQGPTSANLSYTEKYTNALPAIYKKIPETEAYGIINGFKGANSAFSFLVLKPWNQRQRSAMEIAQTLFPQYAAITGMTAFPFVPNVLPGTGGAMPISFVLKTTGTYEELNTVMDKLLTEARKNTKLVNLDSNLKINNPEIDLEIDRNRAADLGVPMSSLSNTLQMLLGEPTVSYFILRGRSYDVIPKLQAKFIDNPSALNNIQVATTSGKLVPLSNFVTIKETIVPKSLGHFQQTRSATLSGSLAPDYTLGEALHYLEGLAKQLFPEDMAYDFSGISRQFVEASGTMMQTFIFAVIFILLVLSAQFESFRDPLIVMLCVPLSLAGAMFTMHLTHCTMNIYTQIGLVTLIGLISKHGILLVEFANQLQTEGREKVEAILESAKIRLRPILMTTGAMILSAIPLALASGAGAGARRQIGWVIVGGLGFGTLFTLFVIPTAYVLFATKKTRKG